MKRINKVLKGYRHICFLDFEGTQFSCEMIAFGAILVTIDKKGFISKEKHPIEFYVKSKNKIGKFVEELTGINEDKLNKVGIPFSQAMREIKKYCGANFNKTIFMTFGNHDMKILNQSISYNLDSPKQITEIIHKNYVDFQAIISEYIKDKDNNPLSLANYLNLFNIGFKGTQHDPKDDAINLARLYQAFLKSQDIVLENYLRTLSQIKHLPNPIKNAINKLASGKNVSAEAFKNDCKEELK